jgi:nucleoside-diphosphate-sugar epimerase
MQTILGSGGAIGTELAISLQEFTDEVKLVSRNPKKINPSNQLFQADLLKQEEVGKAVEGSEIVYLTVGLPYNAKIWKDQWPVVMQNVISACKKFHAKLVFFDNIYMLDPAFIGNMTEETPVKPCSKKGKVRAQVAQLILDEIKAGTLQALIARSADFYGPGIKNSVLLETVYKNLKNGKKAYWFCSLKYKHSYTYTPDAAIATALLGNTESAYNQIWHLPTAKDPLTGEDWIKAFASQLETKPKSRVTKKFMIQTLGLFNPIMKEFVEMIYQYDRDYVFNSSKFESCFDFKPTPYLDGIKKIIIEDAISYISKH